MQRRDASLSTASQPADTDELIPRIEASRQALGNCSGVLDDIAEKATIQWFTFDQAAVDRGQYTPDGSTISPGPAVGQATALGDSAIQAVDKLAGKNVLAVLLISDGRSNTTGRFAPERFAELMASRKVPVFTACVGAERVTKATHSLSVKDLQAPDRVEVLNRLPYSTAIEVMGLLGRMVRVTTLFGDQVIDTRDLLVRSDEELLSFQAVHIPMTPGYSRLTVKAQVLGPPVKELSGQSVTSKLVNVAQNELRVLYVERKIRYEANYINWALLAAQRFKVDRRTLLHPISREHPANGLPETLDGWLGYHAIIFGDIGPDSFTPRQLDFIRQAVSEYGKGFCMMGGSRSFGRGGWQNTPLADVLGVDLGASAGDLDAEIKVTPVPDAVANELMKIGKEGEDPLAAWAKLSPLPGANRLGGVKPAAVVLATTADKQPLIVAQQYGKGHSLAIAFETTWNWVLNREDTADYQRRFWRQVALYLANPTGSLWVETDLGTYELPKLVRKDQTVTLRVGVEDSKGVPLPKAPINVTVTNPAGEKRMYVVPESSDAAAGGKLVRTLDLDTPSMPGVYIMQAQAEVEGKKLQAEHRIEVVSIDLENLDVLANPSLMRRIASISRGAGAGDETNEPHYRPVGRLNELLEQMNIQSEPRPEAHTESRNFSRELSWPVLIVFISLLCMEWALRKRMGLV